jgi:hypothetical protein
MSLEVLKWRRQKSIIQTKRWLISKISMFRLSEDLPMKIAASATPFLPGGRENPREVQSQTFIRPKA